MPDFEKEIQALRDEIQQLRHETFKEFIDHTLLQQKQISSRRGQEGPQGETGASSTVPGPAGRAGTIRIGTVVDGAEAQVTNSGTSTDAVLNFVLPRGEASTIAGPQGPSGRDATNGRDGKDGLSRNEIEALVHQIVDESSVVKEANALLLTLKSEVEKLQNAVKVLKSL